MTGTLRERRYPTGLTTWGPLVASGNPLSQRQVMTRFGLSRTAERRVRQEVTAGVNGHG